MKPILEAGEETVVRSDVCKTSPRRNNCNPLPPCPIWWRLTKAVYCIKGAFYKSNPFINCAAQIINS